MKKISLFFEILRLSWNYLRVYPLRKCMVKERTPKGETRSRFVKDERIGAVFVFGSKEGIDEKIIKKAFPKASIDFQCARSVPAAPHRLVGETVGYRRGERIVFIDPWNAEDAVYLGKKGIMGFEAAHLFGLFDSMINEWKQKIYLASYENGEIKPHYSYFRELDGPELILFRLKRRIKELFSIRMSLGFSRLIPAFKEGM
jgi:hypothetical protein